MTACSTKQVSFLEGRRLEPDEHEAYERPSISLERASLYEHCARAVAISLATGAHGLPLIGTGDWNDGMNLVGAEGRGESVWLAWFLLSILPPFAALAESRGDTARATEYRRIRRAAAHERRGGVGRRMVPARLFRRWDAAGVAGEHGVPHRRHRAVLGGALGRG